jgi:hypothetical protein
MQSMDYTCETGIGCFRRELLLIVDDDDDVESHVQKRWMIIY